jgi:hypothetical protein
MRFSGLRQIAIRPLVMKERLAVSASAAVAALSST